MSYTRGKGKSSKGKETLTKAGVFIRAYEKVVNKMPEFTAPSRKVDDDVKDFNTPKSNITDVVTTLSEDSITWDLHDKDKRFGNGKKVLEVTANERGLRIHIGPNKPVLGYVGGKRVVLEEPMEQAEKVPIELSVAEMAKVAFNEPTGDGEWIVAQVVVETAQGKKYLDPTKPTGQGKNTAKEHVVGQTFGKLGKKYLDSIRPTGPTEGEDPTPTNSDKDDDTTAPGINESAEGWYVGTDPQDDREAMGDGLDEKDEYDKASEVHICGEDDDGNDETGDKCVNGCDYVFDEDEEDEYDKTGRAWIMCPQTHYPEHCQHCALKDPELAYGIVRVRMEHRAELLITLRTTARELLIQSGVKEEMKSILRHITLDNTLSQTERLEISDVMGDGYEDALEKARIGSYDVIQIDDIVTGSYWRIGIWVSDIEDKQTLVTCEERVNGPIAGDRYSSYQMARNAVEILNGEDEGNG